MELVYTYVKKYASANYHSCTDEPLKSQFDDLLAQCHQGNARLLGKRLKKKVKKERLANEIAVLLRIKDISEQMGEEWQSQRRHFGEGIERVSENLLKIAAATSNERDELQAKIASLSGRNTELEEQIYRCSIDCEMKGKLLESLRIKLSEMEELGISLERKLANADSQLLAKEQCIVSLNEHKGTCQLADICTINEEKGHDETQSDIAPIAANQNNSLITIQERLTLCQILGEFNTLESPVSLSNKFEALVLKFQLSNEDACSLLKAWLPGPLVGQLSAWVNDNLADAEVRRKELQRIVDSRDNGMGDLQQMKFRRGDDPILFCSEYLTLYTKVLNCPDLLEDDASFIYSMANKCYVSYPTRMALRNARSYQNFVNILRDFCQESSYREYGSKADADTSDRNDSGVGLGETSDESIPNDYSSDDESVKSVQTNVMQQCESLSPYAQRRTHAGRPTLKCFLCKKGGHIARYCWAANNDIKKRPQHPKTTPRRYEVYSVRWGSNSHRGRNTQLRQSRHYYEKWREPHVHSNIAMEGNKDSSP